MLLIISRNKLHMAFYLLSTYMLFRYRFYFKYTAVVYALHSQYTMLRYKFLCYTYLNIIKLFADSTNSCVT